MKTCRRWTDFSPRRYSPQPVLPSNVLFGQRYIHIPLPTPPAGGPSPDDEVLINFPDGELGGAGDGGCFGGGGLYRIKVALSGTTASALVTATINWSKQ